MKKRFVVAVSQREAEEIAEHFPECVHDSAAEAAKHLAQVKFPPTDSYYASQYRAYRVTDKSAATTV